MRNLREKAQGRAEDELNREKDSTQFSSRLCAFVNILNMYGFGAFLVCRAGG